MLESLLEFLIQGLVLGGLYALFAVGLSLIFGVLDVINVAHGEFFAIGGYLAFAAVVLLHLPDGFGAAAVQEAMVEATSRLPEQLRKTLTWDQGHEMAAHAKFTDKTGIEVYFCDPKSPWQRGSNENTNGLLRQYFPKKAPLSGYSQAYLDKIALRLNTRPRKTLGFQTPAQRLDAVLQ